MASADHAKVVLVWAPAGFGKTNLMAQWLAYLKDQGKPVAWLTLDEADNDPARFLSYLIAALHKADPSLNTGDLEPGPLESGGFPIGTILGRLEGRGASAVPITLFLDEFEVLKSGEVLGAIQYLLLHMPAGIRMVIATRDLPKISLSKIYTRGDLLEIDMDGLRFNYEETEQFVRKTQGLNLKDKEIASLLRYTEGWVAGLQLTTLSLSWQEDAGNISQPISGSFHKIAEYLAEDVLARQPEEVQSFLIQTSILDRLSGPLCDALTGRTDGSDMLNGVERANLFLTPLDEERRWFRYHSLFAKFLRSRLERGSRDRLVQLNKAAASWYAKEGDLLEAAKHSMTADDPETAARHMDRCAVHLLTGGHVATVAEWGERLPQPVLRHYPAMQFAYCTALVLQGEYVRAARFLESLDREARHPVDIPFFKEHLLALQSLILVAQDRIGECEHVARQGVESSALANMPEGHSMLFLIAGLFRIAGWVELTLGKFDESLKYLDHALKLDRQVSSQMGNVYDKYLKGRIEFTRGRMQVALARCRSALEETGPGPSRYLAGETCAAVLQAEILYEMDNLEGAEALLSAYRALLPICIPVDEGIVGFRTLARICIARGDYSGAISHLAELERSGASGASSRAAASSRLEQVQIAIRLNDIKRAVQLSRNRDEQDVWPRYEGRCMPANDPETPEIGRLRLRIAQGQPREALESLKGVLKQAEDAGRFRQAVLVQILLARAYEECGERKPALRYLKEALTSAQNEGYIRSFADEGGVVTQLVRELRKTAGPGGGKEGKDISAEYLDRILRASGVFTPPVPEPAGGPVSLEPLTRQEILILEQLATGLSNEALADKLCISKHTVRFHLRNIHSKLGASNRTEAVALARRHGIIA
jgi:LuxR family transcriptional regulator, maltose regulon positive regulatory protein